MFLKDKNKQSRNISDKISGVIFTIFVWSLNGAGGATGLVIKMRDDSPALLSDILITMTTFFTTLHYTGTTTLHTNTTMQCKYLWRKILHVSTGS